uniref:Uncharacterized protein n=1 Tax=Lepeophtheirus salmonis TaxID=72036 RepID=A0A0K2VJB2_LEPSM
MVKSVGRMLSQFLVPRISDLCQVSLQRQKLLQNRYTVNTLNKDCENAL